MAAAYYGLGVNQKNRRSLSKALELHQKAVELNEEIDAKRDLPYIYNDLGSTYSALLELELSLEYYLKYLAFLGEQILGVQVVFSNIGAIYHQMGKYNLAMKYNLKALKKCEEIGDKRRILPAVLYNLITLSIDKNEHQKAQQYLEQLRLINQIVESEKIYRLYRFTSGLVLKADTRMSDWSKAAAIFEEVLIEENLPPYWQVIALINHSAILLKELQISGELEILEEVKNKVNVLVDIASKEQFHVLLAQAYWLFAQLALAELDIEKAKDYLMKAGFITEDKGLKKLAEDIAEEQQKLANQLSMWENLVKQKKPIVEALKHLSLENGITRITKDAVIEERDKKTGQMIEYRKLFVLKI
ncbi:MAG: tetratricopeptide repeat protein [Candidatus Heimdallarchaeota archaeon]